MLGMKLHGDKAKTPAERKADERERMRAGGFVLRQMWVHPKDWERLKAYALRLLESLRKK
jgi:hypothetical protein